MKPALFACLVYFIPLSLLASLQLGDEQFLSLLQINSSYFDNKTEVHILLKEAWACKHIDRAKALNLVAEAKQLAVESNAVEEEAAADYIHGLLQLSFGEWLDARLLFSQSLEKIEDLGKEKEYTAILTNRAKLDLHMGNIEAAERDFDRLFSFAEKTADQATQAILLNYQGKVAEAKQDFPVALSKYAEAFRISKSINDKKTNVESLLLLGNCYVKKGDTALGIEKLTHALTAKQKQGDQEGEASIMILLARAFILQDDAKALELAKKTLSIGKALKNNELKLQAYGMMEEIQVERENYEEAYRLKGLTNQILQENRGKANPAEISAINLVRAEVSKQEAALLLYEKKSHLQRYQTIAIAIFLLVFGLFCFRMFRTHEETNNMLNLRNEELEMSKSALEKFAYATSHDLKEPLRTIGSFSSLVSKRYANNLGKEGGEYMDFIVRGVDQMYNLLDDLRIYSSLFQDNNIPPRQVDLKEVLAAVELCVAENPKSAKVKISIPPNLPSIMGNPIQMHHLFLNLVNNAIQHNDKTFPIVQIKCEEMKNVLLFKIIDNGNGIAEKYHEKIFHAFKRLSRKQQPGSGIGLAVCKKIVEKHHGCIWLDSKVGEGTTFSFTIPRKQVKHLPIFQRFHAHFNKTA